jgi:hypothetical protein
MVIGDPNTHLIRSNLLPNYLIAEDKDKDYLLI